jgi:tRNA-splicing endonuclease subunit Sen34
MPTIPRIPTSEEVERRREERVKAIKQLEEKKRMEEGLKAKQGKERFERSGDVGKDKREERARLRAEKAKARGDAGGELFGGTEPVVDAQRVEVALSKVESKGGPSSAGYFHSIPSHPILPPIEAPESHLSSLPHFPKTPRDHALRTTFSTLHTLGLRLGLGPRFGGEYLIYPGDYLRYHAHFTSQVIVRDEIIRPAEIVAWGRLGTGTKKAGLLCCWDDGPSEEKQVGEGGQGEVEFYSLEWANFG